MIYCLVLHQAASFAHYSQKRIDCLTKYRSSTCPVVREMDYSMTLVKIVLCQHDFRVLVAHGYGSHDQS
jgi:hypothetical protein